MTDKSQLPFLIKLVDDDTAEVREEVLKELTNYGSGLELDLAEFADILEYNKVDLIYPIIESSRRKWLKENWSSWHNEHDDYLKLEKAAGLIAKYQFGLTYKNNLSDTLNEFTTKFISYYPHGDEFDLAYFLFRDERIQGEKHDFYNPLNSNLLYALQEKKGLPITLSLIFMLIGKRVGFIIEGCNFPGHFLTKINNDGQTVFIDCFNRGKTIYENEIKDLLKDSYDSLLSLLHEKTNANLIIKRIVNNLVIAYKENNNQLDRFLFSELLVSTPWNKAPSKF
jgi:regulator of sirC expression with transglutaminase-like and TPR domain